MIVNKIDRSKIYKMNEKIEATETIIICRHVRPDLDAIGSQIALKMLLSNKYPNKKIYAHCEKVSQEFNFIGQGEIVAPNLFNEALIITLDTANYERMEAPSDFELRVNKERIIKIDHHPNVDRYAELDLVDETISSTSELLIELFIEKLEFNLTAEIANSLFVGIYGDTGGFAYNNTSAKTFKRIALLVEENFAYEETMLKLREMDLELVQVMGWIYQNIEIENEVGIIRLTTEILKEFKVKNNRISVLVNSLGIIKELKAWTLMIEYEHFIRVNLRSKGNINISKIAEKFNGGGHKNASGATIKKWSEAEEIIEEVKLEVINSK